MNLSLRPCAWPCWPAAPSPCRRRAGRPQKAQPAQVSAAASARVRKDDLFAHVNADWLAQTEIPADKGADGRVHLALRDQSDRDIRA